MPWNDQSGSKNPWGGSSGGNNQGPWRGGGRPNGGGQNRPPDIEDVIRKAQERMRNMFPNGFGGTGRFLFLLIILAILLWLGSGFYRVESTQVGVVQRFGAFERLTEPGLRYHLPWPVETVQTPVVTQENRIEVGGVGASGGDTTRGVDDSFMLTGDQNIIDIDFVVQWRISDARAYLFNIRNVEETIKLAAQSVMREIIGRTDVQSARTEGRGRIEQEVLTDLQALMDAYGAGVNITEINLINAEPPAPVIDAFNEVQSAQQEAVRIRNQAEAYRNRVLPEARGQAEQIIQEAEGYAEETVARAAGEAERFRSVLDAYSLAPEVTSTRMYLEAMQEVLGTVDKIIIDPSIGNGIVPYLPLQELGRNSGTQTQRAE